MAGPIRLVLIHVRFDYEYANGNEIPDAHGGSMTFGPVKIYSGSTIPGSPGVSPAPPSPGVPF